MSRAEELVEACLAAVRAGADFPTIWHTILKRHPSVVGVPIQGGDHAGARLEIPLLSGERIVIGPSTADYAISFGPGAGAVF